MSMWQIIIYACWALSAAFGLWMVYDWYKTDSTYSEATLTSSREGEIEMVAEKHQIDNPPPA